jgi:type VI secretion system ImpM family protein
VSKIVLSPTSISFYGKLPWVGDFIVRNLDFAQHRQIDRWLSAGLSALRDADPNWLEAYISAPVWNFILPAGVWGEQAVCGAIMPSVDKVGRYFPFILFFDQDAVVDIQLRNKYQASIVALLPGLLEREVLVDEITDYILQGLNSAEEASIVKPFDCAGNIFHAKEKSGCWWKDGGGFVLNYPNGVDVDLFITLFGGERRD